MVGTVMDPAYSTGRLKAVGALHVEGWQESASHTWVRGAAPGIRGAPHEGLAT